MEIQLVGGTLGVTGVTTLSDAATVGGTLGVTGVTTNYALIIAARCRWNMEE